MSEQMLVPSNELDRGPTRFKMLGALAAGAVLGLLVGLPWGREGNALTLGTIVQTLAAISVPASLLYSSLRRPMEPLCLPDVSHIPSAQVCM
jgi:hypothetical protein